MVVLYVVGFVASLAGSAAAFVIGAEIYIYRLLPEWGAQTVSAVGLRKVFEGLPEGIKAFNAALPANKDKTKLGDNAAATFLETFNKSVADKMKGLTAGGSINQTLLDEKKKLVDRVAESLKPAARADLGDDPERAAGITGGIGGNKNAQAALRGSSDAASAMTRGMSSPMQKQLSLTAEQLKIQKKMLAVAEADSKQNKPMDRLVLANF